MACRVRVFLEPSSIYTTYRAEAERYAQVNEEPEQMCNDLGDIVWVL